MVSHTVEDRSDYPDYKEDIEPNASSTAPAKDKRRFYKRPSFLWGKSLTCAFIEHLLIEEFF
jgi:hypothetical protein